MSNIKFASTWESLQQYQCPEWFRDAKFGIWAHWGPQGVPMFGDWYARNMYMEGTPAYHYHCRTYGHPSKFGYKDLVALWQAEKFDPQALLERYVAAGARYVVACTSHCDNFDCWDSKYHRWNSVNFGPRRDILGEFATATRTAGLRFGAAEHFSRAWSWFNTNKGADRSGPYAGVPYDGNDPAYQDFYLPAHEDFSSAYPQEAPESWMRHWQDRICDVVDRYAPDLLYTDGAVPFGAIGREVIAHFYNANQRRMGALEAVYNVKDHRHLDPYGYLGEYREGIGVLDVERGVVDGIQPKPWQTDTCIGDWYYNTRMAYKTPVEVIRMLVDVVSKNGNLLLNMPLHPDGTLDRECRWIADQIGEWMNMFGEGIYATRPFDVFGEGPTRLGSGTFGEDEHKAFTGEDFRFTRKGNVIYAFMMQWPASGFAELKSLRQGKGPETIRQVELVGPPAPCRWRRQDQALVVSLPGAPVSRLVNALRITVD